MFGVFFLDSARALDSYLALIDTNPPLPMSYQSPPATTPHLQVPKRRYTTAATTGQATQPVSQLQKHSSPLPSMTAPPTSLTLATNHGSHSAFGSSKWVIKPSGGLGSNTYMKPLRETVVGFIGASSPLAKKTALMISKGLSMKVIYHQKYPL